MGLERKMRKNHRKTGSHKNVKSNKHLAVQQDLESHAVKGLPLESYIIFPFLIFFFLLQNQWQHFYFPRLFEGMQPSLDITVGLQFCFQNTGSLTTIIACPPISHRRPVSLRAF